MEPTNRCSTTSSSFVCAARAALAAALLRAVDRERRPLRVAPRLIVRTTSSSAMRSSTARSPASATISVRRGRPNVSRISESSARMIAETRSLFARMSFRSAIAARTSRNSATIFSRSRPVRRWRRMSRIACACVASRRSRSSSLRAEAAASRLAAPRNFSSAAFGIETSCVRRARGLLGVLALPDDRDDVVEVRERDREAEEQVRALLRLLEVEERAAHDDLAAVVEEVPEEVLERQDARLPVHDRERDDPERGLERGRREELVQDDLRDGVALQVDDDPHAVAVRLVADRRDALDPLVVDETGDLLDEARLVDLERELRDDDRLAVALLRLLDLRAPAHLQDAAARLVGVHDALPAEDDSARRKVGARHHVDEPARARPSGRPGERSRRRRPRRGCAARSSSPCRRRCPRSRSRGGSGTSRAGRSAPGASRRSSASSRRSPCRCRRRAFPRRGA